MLKIDKPTL